MRDAWLYLYKVLWNWAGILLAVDAFVALMERYLGEIVERRLHWKPHVPTSIKLGFAVAVLIVAQGIAYRDSQRELLQAGRDNEGLHAAINSLNARLSSQEQELKRLKDKPPKVIYRESSSSEDPNTKAKIAAGLQKVYNDGQKIRDMLLNSDDSLGEKESNDQFSAWRSELRTYIAQHISSGKAQYVDGIPTVFSMSYSSMKSVMTRTTKENLITHINARLERLSEVMKDY
jgi:hypothetical protein